MKYARNPSNLSCGNDGSNTLPGKGKKWQWAGKRWRSKWTSSWPIRLTTYTTENGLKPTCADDLQQGKPDQNLVTFQKPHFPAWGEFCVACSPPPPLFFTHPTKSPLP